jgi:uncharacterized membrane protein YfcA
VEPVTPTSTSAVSRRVSTLHLETVAASCMLCWPILLMPHLAAWQWILGAFCALMIGVAKTGVPGIATVVIPLMVITVGDARLSAAWILPILMMADVYAVVYWRRHTAARRLFSLVPWVLVGMLAGAAALSLPERSLRLIVAAIVLIMLGFFLRRRWKPEAEVTSHAATYGIAAGFATTVASAAGPVMNLYLLSKRLSKEEFVATGAWFFFAVNLTKVPIYLSYGLFSARSVMFDLILAPAVVVGALAGRWIVRRTPQRAFEVLVIVMTAVSLPLLFR